MNESKNKIIHFNSQQGDESFMLIRTLEEPTKIGLNLSLEKGNDVEVFINKDECIQIIKALEKIILSIK